MDKKARTPIFEYEDSFAIELPGSGAPRERDTLDDQGIVVAYDRVPGAPRRWRLRALYFDREQWTRSGIRRWWAAHEVDFLAEGQLNVPIPEICRAYPAPEPSLPAIFLCHRNTPMIPARKQMQNLKGEQKGPPHR